jgi:hypothetical protein
LRYCEICVSRTFFFRKKLYFSRKYAVPKLATDAKRRHVSRQFREILHKMNIFNRNTRKKHLKQFEIEIAELLSNEFPEFKKVIEISKLYGINFMEKPQGIYLTRGYEPKVFEEIKRNYDTCFDLIGVSVFEKNTEKYIPLKLNYLHSSLTKIEIENPKQFHKIYDLNKIKIEEIKIKHIKLENPDKNIVVKILRNIDKEKLNLLDLENTFEIEIDEKSFFTILDMEDGNYIAIDELGKVYRLNHDNKERVKILSENIMVFFEIFNGQKSEIEKFMNK